MSGNISYPEPDQAVPLHLNENLFLDDEYYGELKGVMDVELSGYPSPTGEGLRKKLAEYYGLRASQIVIGNGSDSILDTLFKITIPTHGKMGYFTPSYEMYKFFASRNGIHSIEIPLSSDFGVPTNHDIFDDIDTLLVCSPNNPTGLCIADDVLRRILDTDITVIVDEAYVEYSSQDFIPLLEDYDNLILVRTFSKAWGLAGIRLGYSISSSEMALDLSDMMLPYNVNCLSLTVAEKALDMSDLKDESIRKTVEVREWFREELEMLDFNTIPSESNFLLCRPPSGIEPNSLFEQLLEEGFRVRIFESRRLVCYMRITIGEKKNMKTLLEVLDEVL
ncbi:MAG: histidinol-phosphate transaminase [Thermoplasmata archaeon]